MNLLDAIPKGKENARSRAEISRLTGINDRELRSQIKQLNKELVKSGMAIISSSGKSGYWKTNDISEMEEYIREMRHRQQILQKNAAPIIDLIYKTRGVRAVPVRSHFRKISERDERQVTF